MNIKFYILLELYLRVMNLSQRGCRNDPDKFCYICEEYTFKNQRKAISDFVRKIYLAYFKVKFVDQDKPWAPHIVCKACIESLRKWANGTLKCLRFGENQKTILMSATFVWWTNKSLIVTRKRLGITRI